MLKVQDYIRRYLPEHDTEPRRIREERDDIGDIEYERIRDDRNCEKVERG